jgi:hypothetical protein
MFLEVPSEYRLADNTFTPLFFLKVKDTFCLGISSSLKTTEASNSELFGIYSG